PASMRCTAPRRSGRLTAQAKTLARTSSPKNRRPKRCGSDQRGRLMAASATRYYFGGMRSAPSRRMVSPFNIAFSTMWRAKAANSGGLPSRGGKGICAASAWRCGSGSSASIGVSNVPGAIVHTRIPTGARSRAIGSVIATTPPFGAGRVLGHLRSAQAQDVEGADEIDLDDLGEDLERHRPGLAGGLHGRAGAGAIYVDVNGAEG